MNEGHIEKRVGQFDDVLDIEIETKPWEQRAPHSVLVTRNGYQWSGFALQSIEEVEGLIDALQQYVREVKG